MVAPCLVGELVTGFAEGFDEGSEKGCAVGNASGWLVGLLDEAALGRQVGNESGCSEG